MVKDLSVTQIVFKGQHELHRTLEKSFLLHVEIIVCRFLLFLFRFFGFGWNWRLIDEVWIKLKAVIAQIKLTNVMKLSSVYLISLLSIS